jgi:hypothetical protein
VIQRTHDSGKEVGYDDSANSSKLNHSGPDLSSAVSLSTNHSPHRQQNSSAVSMQFVRLMLSRLTGKQQKTRQGRPRSSAPQVQAAHLVPAL